MGFFCPQKKNLPERELHYLAKQREFDIIFLDPPYKLNLINDCLMKIVEYNLLSEDGIIVCEYETEEIENSNLILVKEKKYGSKNVKIYKL